MIQKDEFYKRNDTDTIWFINNHDFGAILFSFDKEKIYNLFADYPWNMTNEEVAIFDCENPFWADFLSDRKKGG